MSRETNAKFEVYLRDADEAAADEDKLDSLRGEGPLQVSTLNVLAKALPDEVVKADGDEGMCDATEHMLEYLFVTHARITPALKTKPVLWAVNKDRLTRWLVALDKAGVDWTACDVDTLSERIKAAGVPTDDRALVDNLEGGQRVEVEGVDLEEIGEQEEHQCAAVA